MAAKTRLSPVSSRGWSGEAERRVQNPPQRVQSLPLPARSSNPQPAATFAKSRIRLCHRSYVNGATRALITKSTGLKENSLFRTARENIPLFCVYFRGAYLASLLCGRSRYPAGD